MAKLKKNSVIFMLMILNYKIILGVTVKFVETESIDNLAVTKQYLTEKDFSNKKN